MSYVVNWNKQRHKPVDQNVNHRWKIWKKCWWITISVVGLFFLSSHFSSPSISLLFCILFLISTMRLSMLLPLSALRCMGYDNYKQFMSSVGLCYHSVMNAYLYQIGMYIHRMHLCLNEREKTHRSKRPWCNCCIFFMYLIPCFSSSIFYIYTYICIHKLNGTYSYFTKKKSALQGIRNDTHKHRCRHTHIYTRTEDREKKKTTRQRNVKKRE